MPIITFLSDFGLTDEYVSVCKGVIKKIAPEVEIIDITHQVPSFDIRKGAFFLSVVLPFMPAGVHLAVVDPGVGTDRRGIILQVKRGDFLIGPDNGLLIPAAQKLYGIIKAIEITNEKFFLGSPSPTFHTRDIFAPVAAYLSQSVSPEEFGKAINPASLVKPPWGRPRKAKRQVELEVINVDKFGSIRFNLEAKDLIKFGLNQNKLILNKGGREIEIPILNTFGKIEKGKPLFYLDSSNLLALAVNQGDASSFFGLKEGDRVRISLTKKE